MTAKILADIPLSVFEYRAVFQYPIFAAFEKPTVIAAALYEAFREWNVTFENITLRSAPATANELHVGCDLFNKRVVFAVMVSAASLIVTNPNWSEAALVQAINNRGMSAVQSSTQGVVKEQIVTLAMHLKPKGKSIKEITSRFRLLDSGPGIDDRVRGFGFSVYGEEMSWLIDLSAGYSDALFLRINRVFGASTPFEEIAATLFKDEEAILNILELKVD